MSMEIDRRGFVKSAVLGGIAMQAGRALGANDRVRIAVCGTRGRGHDHIKGFQNVPGVEIVALCDIDENVSASRADELQKAGLPKPKTYVDLRKMLEDKSIDAVTIATPNHWHSLM